MALTDRKLADLEARDCQHIAALIKSVDELPALLASFFAIGAARNGWLVHGSRPGEVDADVARLRGAGMDVDGLQASGQLAVLELDLDVTPEEWVKPWTARLDERLRSGYDAMWFARFPVGPTDADVEAVLPFERAWKEGFHGRRVVTLCPYISPADVDEPAESARLDRVRAVHDFLLDLGPA